MRTLVYTVHQTLTPRLLQFRSNIKPAKRRGHSQVTPLHVTSTILTSTRSNFFRRACLKSHPLTSFGRQIAHPSLYFQALELCFNVSFNRIPTNPNSQFQTQPSLANALVAALRRAHAHQRRWCAEQQQSQQNQPFLAATCGYFFELFLSRPKLSILFNSLITVLDALVILNQTHSHQVQPCAK